MVNDGLATWAFVVGLSAALIGCGGDSATDKCDTLVDVVCNRGVECLGGTMQECVQSVQQSLPCGKAKSVGPSYERCLDQLSADSCPVLFPTDPSTGQATLALPADCEGVILFP